MSVTHDRLHPALVAGVGVREGVMGERDWFGIKRRRDEKKARAAQLAEARRIYGFDLSDDERAEWLRAKRDPGGLSDAGGRVEP